MKDVFDNERQNYYRPHSRSLDRECSFAAYGFGVFVIGLYLYSSGVARPQDFGFGSWCE